MTLAVRILSAREVAGAYKVSVGYVYNLASQLKWRRIKYDGRVYYSADEVDKALGRD
jgi:hypothetical protein